MSPAVPVASRGTRCAAHPSRLAVDLCPTCRRPRCAADAAAPPLRGCPACPRSSGRPARGGAGRAERFARTGLALNGICILGALVGYDYVKDHVFSLLLPGLVGLACQEVVRRLSGGERALRLLAGGYAGLSALLAFRVGGESFDGPGTWLPPLALSVVVALDPPVGRWWPRSGRS